MVANINLKVMDTAVAVKLTRKAAHALRAMVTLYGCSVDQVVERLVSEHAHYLAHTEREAPYWQAACDATPDEES